MSADPAERRGGRSLAPVPETGFWSAATLATREARPRPWIVPDAIPANTVTNLSGDGGAGKSQIALQLSASVALGKPWLGREVKQGPAIYLAAEDDEDEIHRRLLPVVASMNAELADLRDLHIRSVSHGDSALVFLGAGRADPTPLGRDLIAKAAEIRPRLIVLDTAADLFAGSEIDRAQVTAFIRFLRQTARDGCAVLLLTHPSVTGRQTGTGTSGSTGWQNAVRSHLYLTRVQGDEDARRLEDRKMNYGRRGAFKLALRWRDGLFVPDARQSGEGTQAALPQARATFLRLLDWHLERGVNVNGRPDGKGGGDNYAPTLFAKHEGADGIGKGAFRAAMVDLFAEGEIALEEHGPATRKRSHIVRTEGVL